MIKDKFQGHSVKRPYVGGLGKYWKRQNNKAVRRLSVDVELPVKGNMHHRVHPNTCMAKLNGDDCGNVRRPHDFIARGYSGSWSQAGGWYERENGDKLFSYAKGSVSRVRFYEDVMYLLK